MTKRKSLSNYVANNKQRVYNAQATSKRRRRRRNKMLKLLKLAIQYSTMRQSRGTQQLDINKRTLCVSLKSYKTYMSRGHVRLSAALGQLSSAHHVCWLLTTTLQQVPSTSHIYDCTNDVQWQFVAYVHTHHKFRKQQPYYFSFNVWESV